MTIDAKEWKSIDEQASLIRSRGMTIDDEEKAKHFLRRVGYYRLSGYWYPFRQMNEERKRMDGFQDGSRFEDVIDLYLFDRQLRLLALDAIERIELSIQVEIAHLLGQRDVFAHQNSKQLFPQFSAKKNKWDGKTGYQKWQEEYEKLVSRAKRKTFVAHNLKKYGKLPIWVAVETWDFGALSKFYSGMKTEDKIAIEKQFGLNEGKHLQTWLRGLNFIRNTSAHHSRLWNCNIIERASVPRHKTDIRQLNDSRPFLYFCIMQIILKIIAPDSTWKHRFTELLNKFPVVENQAIKIDEMGAVNNWQEWNLWK